jgi:hypothetical protein
MANPASETALKMANLAPKNGKSGTKKWQIRHQKNNKSDENRNFWKKIWKK